MTRRTFFEADLIDQQREEEERKLVLAEEREKESSNGGGKGKEGGEGRKVNSAAPKCSPAVSKAQLGKKGVCMLGGVQGCASEEWKVGRRRGEQEDWEGVLERKDGKVGGRRRHREGSKERREKRERGRRRLTQTNWLVY